MKRIFFSVFAVIGLASVFIFQNCSKLSFSPTGLESSSAEGATGPQCTLNETLLAQPTKVIFLVDQSASNNLEGLKNTDGTPQDTSQSTDPSRSFRLSALNGLMSLNAASANLSYAISGFWSYSTTAVIDEWSSGFQTDPTILSSAVSSFASKTTPCAVLKSNDPNYRLSDCGGTPYVDALKSAQAKISASDEFRYVIIMISDGLPSGSSQDPSVIAAAKADVLTEIAALTAIKPGKVFVDTVYYHRDQVDPNAVQFLQDMATAGQGSSVSVDSASSIDLGTELKIDTEVCN